MLSFLRENESESKQFGSDNKADDNQYLTAKSRDKSVRNTTYLLSALFCIGLVILVVMMKTAGPAAASASTKSGIENEALEIEKAIARLTGVRTEMFSRMEEIIEKFYKFSNVQQINAGDLVKNPFRLESFFDDLQQIKKLTDFDFDMEGIKKRQLISEAKKMQLLSIMESNGNKCCMINDKILYEGDSIDAFEVIRIYDSFVELGWNGSGDRELSQEQKQDVKITLRLLK